MHPAILFSVTLCSMQKHFACKGSCVASIGADQPAEVVEDAPKDLVFIYFFTRSSFLLFLMTLIHRPVLLLSFLPFLKIIIEKCSSGLHLAKDSDLLFQ